MGEQEFGQNIQVRVATYDELLKHLTRLAGNLSFAGVVRANRAPDEPEKFESRYFRVGVYEQDILTIYDLRPKAGDFFGMLESLLHDGLCGKPEDGFDPVAWAYDDFDGIAYPLDGAKLRALGLSKRAARRSRVWEAVKWTIPLCVSIAAVVIAVVRTSGNPNEQRIKALEDKVAAVPVALRTSPASQPTTQHVP